jgi:hypothetical protein
MKTPPSSRIPSSDVTPQLDLTQRLDRGQGIDAPPNELVPGNLYPAGIPSTFMRFDDLLRVSAIGWRPFFLEVDYLPLTAHCPIHMGISQETMAWIVTHLEIIGEEIPSDKTKLGPGSLVHLHNITLAQLNIGFESPWVCGAIREYPRCEAGFHIFSMEVHVCTLTLTPHPIPIHVTHVTIPNHLLNLPGASYPIHHCTLGQRFIEGKRNPQPPLCP